MKKTFLKRLISVLLATVLIVSVTTSATAESINVGIEDEDLLINQEVAENIAELFVDDMVSTGQTKWDSDTAVKNTEILYDEYGTNITGYSVELTSGYVVVSAYVDVPSVILEWADEAEPVYDNTYLAEGTKVIYTGPMGYFLDTGTSNLKSFDGDIVTRTQVQNQVASLRNVKNVEASVLQEILAEKKAIKENNKVIARAGNNQSGGYITDAGVYAHNVYGGTWKCTSWYNEWEKYANFATRDYFPGYSKHCGPIAITNAIKMFGNRKDDSIKNTTDTFVFSKVMEANADAGGEYYNGSAGTWCYSAGRFIEDSFQKFYVNVFVTGMFKCDAYNLKHSTASERIMYIILQNSGSPYGDHAVIGYAWSCMTRSSDLGDKHFIKVCDGHNSSGRYLELSLVLDDYYWEIEM